MSEAMRRLPNLLIASLGLRKAFSFLKLNAFLLKLNAFLKDCSWSSTRGSQNLQHCSLREVPGSAPGVLPDSLRECSRIASGSAPRYPWGVLPEHYRAFSFNPPQGSSRCSRSWSTTSLCSGKVQYCTVQFSRDSTIQYTVQKNSTVQYSISGYITDFLFFTITFSPFSSKSAEQGHQSKDLQK